MDTGTGNCTGCVPGEYQEHSGQLHCEIVPVGHFSSSPSSSFPTPCPPGQYQDLQGRTACNVCPTFSTSTAAATQCTACVSNSLCSLSINNVCGNGCGLNQYYDYTTQMCKVCAIGTLNAQEPCAVDPSVCWESPSRAFYLSNQNQILPCAPGSQANSLFNGCISCLQVYYYFFFLSSSNVTTEN